VTADQFSRYRTFLHARTRPSSQPERCVCGATITCPMLRDEIWAAIGNGDRFLCLPCAEARLGREIQIDDLGACYGRLDAKRREMKLRGGTTA